MNFIFLASGITLSITPILTLIEHKPEHIVGCVLIGEDEDGCVPDWFINSTLSDNPAAELLEHLKNREKLTRLDIFLIVKEPDSLLNLNVLAAVGCCNINYSGGGGGGGKAILKCLAKHNIRTYPSEVNYIDKSLAHQPEEASKKAFMHGFNVVASRWLPECWGLPPVHDFRYES
jgi:hypothetical protein